MRSIPDRAVAAGVPARIIGTRDSNQTRPHAVAI
jgi:acetyltransferase-like isoleucine patch superfamily enzyme